MLTPEFYTVLNQMDSLLNDVFYRVCQLRDLGSLFAGTAEYSGGSFSGSQAGLFIMDYCVPAVTDLDSLQESLDKLKYEVSNNQRRTTD